MQFEMTNNKGIYAYVIERLQNCGEQSCFNLGSNSVPL